MFSIILPNYNHARFLNKRIESILNQTFTDFEIIILDDCSSDNSREIIANYQDKRIKYKIFNEENSGSPFKQWKKGLELAKYDYVWIAESDDWADENFLSEAYEAIFFQSDISIFFCDSILVSEDEKPYHNNLQSYTKELNENLWNSSHYIDGKKYFYDYFLYKCIILNASSAVFRKKFALKYIDELKDFKTQGDWLFWCLMLKEGSIFYSAKKLNYFRNHINTTRNYNTKEKREIRILEKIKFYEKISQNFEIPVGFIYRIKKEIINEWIRAHNFREQFHSSFYKISKNSLMRIKPHKLILISLRYKLNNIFNYYINNEKHH